MHVMVAVEITPEDRSILDSYCIDKDIAEHVLLGEIGNHIDYYDENRMKQVDLEDLKKEINLDDYKGYLYAYIDKYTDWVDEPSKRQIEDWLEDVDPDTVFYLVDCHI